ncbi:MAG: S41 family peptidase [Pseudomonadota bacterium]
MKFKTMSVIFIFLLFLTATFATDFTPYDLLIDKGLDELTNYDFLPKTNKLTKQEAQYDLDMLEYILKKGYSGYFFKNKDYIDQQLQKVQADVLANFANGEEFIFIRDFFNIISKIAVKIPDNHFSIAKFAWDDESQTLDSRSNDSDVELMKLGRNIAADETKRCYKLDLDTYTYKGRTIPVLGINDFPVSGHEKWKGLAKIAKKLRKYGAFVIDIRGVTGGSSLPKDFINSFLSKEVSRDLLKVRYLQSPEALALRVSQYKLHGFLENDFDKNVYEVIKDRQAEFEEAIAQNGLEELKFTEPYYKLNIRGNAKENYKGKIIILTDNFVGSEAEDFLYCFLKLKDVLNVKVFGDNTTGAFHFGGIGSTLLKNSKFWIYVGTRFVELENGEFIEKKGFKPDVYAKIVRKHDLITEYFDGMEDDFNLILAGNESSAESYMTLKHDFDELQGEYSNFSDQAFWYATGIVEEAIELFDEDIWN